MRHPYLRLRHRLRRARVVLRAWRRNALPQAITSLWRSLTLPAAVLFLFQSDRIHPAYELGRLRRLALARRMHANARRIQTYTSYKAHLAMAVKLLEMPPEVEGDVVECGCFRGGSTANLSLACELVGRRLIVYDSFEGLPPPRTGDRYAGPETEGYLAASLEEVRENVRSHGAIECCEFRKGWFEDTLPTHASPIVLCFLDVDYEASLRECVLCLWNHLTPRGYLFIDEYVLLDYCALFWSERFWRRHFERVPPGLIGAGSGIGLGEHYLGPRTEMPAIQGPGSIAYTRKDLTGSWEYFPDEPPAST